MDASDRSFVSQRHSMNRTGPAFYHVSDDEARLGHYRLARAEIGPWPWARCVCQRRR